MGVSSRYFLFLLVMFFPLVMLKYFRVTELGRVILGSLS